MTPLQISLHSISKRYCIFFCINLLSLLIAASASASDTPAQAPAAQISSPGAIGNPEKEIEIGTSYESLTNGFPPWKSYYVDTIFRYGKEQIYYLNFLDVERSGIHDSQLSGGLFRRLNHHLSGTLELSLSSAGGILADKEIFGQIQTEIGNANIIHLGHRYRQYEYTSVNISNLTIEKYYLDYRGSYSLLKSSISGSGLQTGHVIQLNKYYNGNSTIGLSISSGKEADVDIPTQKVLRFDTRGVAIVGRHWFNKAAALSYVINIHEQGDSYTRRGLTVGIRRKF